ncbi:MAG: MBOAT family O-acyltransferase [Chthoniobacterales bacterium]
MNFVSVEFWLLLLLCLGSILSFRAVLAARGFSHLAQFDRASLLGTSLLLFYFADRLSFAIHVAELGFSFIVLQAALRSGKRRRLVLEILFITVNLLPLVWFKYGDFLLNRVLHLGWNAPRNYIPAGISFYTFQLIALGVDTLRRNEKLPRLLNFFNFVTFFPQIVAGPIERRASLLPQITGFRWRVSVATLLDGCPWLVLGLFYKLVLADNLSPFILRGVSDNPWTVWLTSILFGLRIYFDFAGYSFIALGVARILGVRLTMNFLAPYSACSIREFWQRWHITLSTWFRDYVYFPLGGNRRGVWEFNIFAVFLISGMWHGAGFNFLLWGAAHGALLVMHGWFSKVGYAMPRVIGWLLTSVAVTFSWLFFYESDLSLLEKKIRLLLTPSAYSTGSLREVRHAYAITDWAPLIVICSLCFFVLLIEMLGRRKAENPYAALLSWPACLGLAAVVAIGAASGEGQFIYFAF